MSNESAIEGTRHHRAPGETPVGDVMSTPVVTVRGNATLWEALERFLMSGLHHLVVLGVNDRCAGVLLDRQVAGTWAQDPLGLRLRRVSDLVDSGGPRIAPSCTVVDAARTMAHHQVDALPVVDAAGHPMGVVTSRDIVGFVARLEPGSPPSQLEPDAGQ